MAPDDQTTGSTASDETLGQPAAAAAAGNTQAALRSSGKKNQKAAKSIKPTMGKLKFPLTQPTERALRLAAILLEDASSGPTTAQEIIEHATVQYLKKLRSSKGLDIPLSLLPE